MPYKSQAQERFFNANRAKMEAQGVDVDEFNAASKGMKLPPRAKKPASQTKRLNRYIGKTYGKA